MQSSTISSKVDSREYKIESCNVEDEFPDIVEVELPDCDRFENLYLIGKMLGEFVLPKNIIANKNRIGFLRGKLSMLTWQMVLCLSNLLMKWIVIVSFFNNLGFCPRSDI